VPIIRRNNCIYVTLGTCNSLWMTVWYAGSALDRVISPDDGHIFARNVYRKEINVLRKIMHQFGFVYKIIQGCRSTKLDFWAVTISLVKLFERISILNQQKMQYLKYNKTSQIISYQVSAPTCSGTRVPSSGSFSSTEVCGSNRYFSRYSPKFPS